MKKFMLRVMPVVLMVFMLVVTPVFAAKENTTQRLDKIENLSGNSVTTVDKAVGTVWNTVLTILQVLAVAAIVFAGVKYMFASAEGKADIKNGMLGLVVGAILVFGASAVVKMIMNAADSVVK